MKRLTRRAVLVLCVSVACTLFGITHAWAGTSPQDVEFDDRTPINGITRPSKYSRDQWCDSDSDWDYAFYFYPRWADDPDDVRWVSWNWRVKSVFAGAYGNKLWGTQLNTSPVILCIGENGIKWAGGPQHVMENLYIHHK